jgi:hypothetical protein
MDGNWRVLQSGLGITQFSAAVDSGSEIAFTFGDPIAWDQYHYFVRVGFSNIQELLA